MKKFLLIAFSATLGYLISCTNQNASTSMEQKNLSADSTIGKAFEMGDVSKIDSVVASDFVDHTDRGDRNRDSLKAMINMMHENFPDMKMDMIRQTADSNYVYTWLRFSGNSNGAMGMPKGPFDMQSMEVTRYNNEGKAVEHWGFMESQSNSKMMQEMMKQMGGSRTDTSKTK
jgi:predicted SnoaL-like aldol condensation-catalyzing enzyme